MNTTEIKKFLESIRETDIEEMEYESGDTSVYIKKSEVTPKIEIPKKQENIQKNNTVIPIKSSTAKGKVIKTLVSNGQSVEYGQELFLVDTAAE